MKKHQKLLTREKDPEKRAFLELIWHVGAAQIDLVSLTAEDVDWNNRVITYARRKTKKPAILRFGDEVAAILRHLPSTGLLFPNWLKLTSAQRADRFHHRREPSFILLRMGGTRRGGRLSRAICTGSIWAYQRGHPPSVRKESAPLADASEV